MLAKERTISLRTANRSTQVYKKESQIRESKAIAANDRIVQKIVAVFIVK